MLERVVRGWVTCCLGAVLVCSSPVLASDASKKAAESLATRAAKAFEAGNMADAANLYREAFHIDGSQPNYLYGAGRAAQTAHDWVHAAGDYESFLALPQIEPSRAQKAKTFLAEVRAALSDAKAAEAKATAAKGDTYLGASLYLEAWRLSPDRPDALLQAAILERQLGDKSSAILHLENYLRVAPPQASGRETAQSLLAQLGRNQTEGAGRPLSQNSTAPPGSTAPQNATAPQNTTAAQNVSVAPPSPLPDPPVVPTAKVEVVVRVESPPRSTTPPQPEEQPVAAAGAQRPADLVSPLAAHAKADDAPPGSWQRPVGWSSLGVGAAALAASAIVAWVAMGQQSELDANLLPNGQFDGRRIAVDAAVSAQAGINAKWTAVGFLGGAGVVAAGVGAALLAIAPSRLSLAPTPSGVTLVGRF